MADRSDVVQESLLASVRSCAICTGLPLGPKPLFQASPDARILIAGQAPGRRAHESGIPFRDPSGDRLRKWLGVDDDAFYDATRIAILPMGFCYPGTGKRGDLPPRPECADAWRQRMLATMPAIRLTILIGMYAQRWHLGEACGPTVTDNVSRWRQFWPELMPLPHPSPRNAAWLGRHPEIESELLPALRSRVADVLR